ncbi:MAG TPA: hypothetical protein VHE30_20735 [Polyangiaceae bacterium]|nr:hypothetical protein [Polyangiaceae bacterium]
MRTRTLELNRIGPFRGTRSIPWKALSGASVALLSCTTAPRFPAPAAHAGEHPSAATEPEVARAPGATSAPPEPVATPVPETPATPVPETPATPPPRFPPPDLTPPSPRSAAAGDGRYTPFGDRTLGERSATDPPLVVKTVLHPHPKSRFVTVTIAAIDLSRVRVRLVAGTDDLAWAKLPVDGDAGKVPAVDRDGLVLVTNGGFQPKHGHRGLVASRVVVSPPRGDGCTILLGEDGDVKMGPFPELGSAVNSAPSLRETPPCLVAHGALHPSLLAGRDAAWAGHASDLSTRRRSALGLDRSGGTLFYAVGEEADPRWLAEALRLAGADVAAELDINWYWTRFLLVGDAGGTLRPTTSLIPKMEHLPTEYVAKASIRDFFYVVRREPSSAGARVKGTP